MKAPNEKTAGVNPAARGISRREMMSRVGGTLAVAAGAAWATKHFYDAEGDAGLPTYPPERLKNYFEQIYDSYGPSAPRVSVAWGPSGEDDLSQESVLKMMTAALGPMGGMERFVRRGDVVLIKPNVAFDRGPRMGATTNPDTVWAAVKMCQAAGARRVIVADNPIEEAAPCFAKSRIRHAAESAGADVMLPSNAMHSPVAIRDREPDPRRHEALGTWEVFYRPLVLADKVIGLPPIKDHNLCFASMGVKNWYGMLSGRRNQFHQAIHDIVSDLGMMMSPTLMLIDGTRVLMRNGPTGGRLDDVTVGGVAGRSSIVASVDQVASDAWCMEHLLGRDPGTLRYLELCEEKIRDRIARAQEADGDDADGKRFAERDWRVYEREGLIRETSVG
jgi:uncharacterized protein (DUF362 family)